jgi:hypothetical protein
VASKFPFSLGTNNYSSKLLKASGSKFYVMHFLYPRRKREVKQVCTNYPMLEDIAESQRRRKAKMDS